MKIKDVMHSPVLTLTFDTTYEDAVKFLLENDITGCPVVNDEGDVIGVISDKDFYKVLYPFYSSYYKSPEDYTDLEKRESKINEIKKNPIERFMSRDVVYCKPDDPIMKVGGIMLARGFHRMPVVNPDTGGLAGIVTRRDIYRTIIKSQLDLENGK